MQSCTSAVVFLFILAITLTNASLSAVPTVKVRLYDSAVLPCNKKCSGVLRWTLFQIPKDRLAECDQTECRLNQEGYQMIHDQYLQGNLSLIIREADFSKRGRYTCRCDGIALCDMVLQVEPLKTTVQIKAGGSLVLEVSGSVEVIYNSTGAVNGSSGQICTADGHSLKIDDKYKQRFCLKSALELRGMEESDSGVYTVRDTRINEDIHIYTVIITDDECFPVGDNCAVVPRWVMTSLGLVLAVLLVVCAASVVVIVQQKKTAEIKGQTQPILQNEKRGSFFS